MRKILFFAILVLLIAGCTSEVPQNNEKIGVLLALSGDIGPVGQEARDSIIAASTNTSQLIFEDTQCDATQAINAYTKLNTIDNIDYFIGPGCGSPQEAVISNADNDIFILLSPASKKLSEKPNVFQAQYTLEEESTFIAQEMNQKYDTVLLITYQNAFAQTHAETFKKEFKGKIIERTYTTTGSNIQDVALTIQAENPDEIYAPDLSFFIDDGMKILTENGIAIPVYSTYVANIESMRSLTKNVTYSYPNINDDVIPFYAAQSVEALEKALQRCDSKDCVMNNIHLEQTEIVLREN